MATLYISPTGAGLRDGSSWQNAGAISQLSSFIGAAGPGGSVLLRADQGPYQIAALTIAQGGTDLAPVTIRGAAADGTPMDAQIVGNRDTTWTRGEAHGTESFRLQQGANNLVFEHLDFSHVGNGAFWIGADVRNLTIRDVEATNVRRFIENTAFQSGGTASIDGLTIRNVEINGYSKGAIRLQYDTRNVLIEDVVGDSQRQTGDDFAMGVHLTGTVHDVVLRRVTMNNSHDSLRTYWNGDGFTTEAGVFNVRFEDTSASGSTDAGYDIKSLNTVLLRAFAEDNKRNYRIWNDGVVIEDSTSLNPHIRGGSGTQAHLWVGLGAEVTITNSRFFDRDADTVIVDMVEGGGASATFVNTRIDVSDDAMRMRLGVSSKLDINGVVYGSEADGTLRGSPGHDYLSSGSGADRLVGESGNDFFYGGAGADTLDGGSGSDTALYLYSNAGVTIDLARNVASGGDAAGDVLLGIENLTGSAWADVLTGNDGANLLSGLEGNDTLQGGDGPDRLDGGAGSDHLEGGRGDDRLTGGAGADTFSFATGFGRDVVTDFQAGDVLRFEAGLFADEASVRAAAQQVGADVVIAKGADHLTLQNVQLSALSSASFAFTGTLPTDTTPPAAPTFTPAAGFSTGIPRTRQWARSSAASAPRLAQPCAWARRPHLR